MIYKKLIILFLLIQVTSGLCSKAKLIFSDRPAFQIGHEIFYHSDVETTKQILIALKCLKKKSILLKTIDFDAPSQQGKVLAIIRLNKILQITSIGRSKRSSKYIKNMKFDRCSKNLSSKNIAKLNEYFLYESELKKKFGILGNTMKINSKFIQRLGDYIKLLNKEIHHHVFL